MAIAPAKTDLLELYEQMLLIRVFETEAERQYKAAQIGGYCHLSSGQEATCVGVVDAMQDDDLLVTGYRSHGFALARGTSPEAVMAELFGRARRLRARARRLDAPARHRARLLRRLGHRRRPAAARHRARARARAPGQAAGGRVRARRRRREHGRLARVAQPRRAVEAADRLPRRQQPLRHGHGGRARLGRAGAVQARERLPDARRARSTATTSRRCSRPARGCSSARARSASPPVLEAITYRYRGHSVADAGLAYRTKEEIAEHQEHDPLLRTARAPARGRRDDRGAARDRRARRRSASRQAVEFADREPAARRRRARRGRCTARARDEQFARMRPGSPFGEEELVFDGGLGK